MERWGIGRLQLTQKDNRIEATVQESTQTKLASHLERERESERDGENEVGDRQLLTKREEHVAELGDPKVAGWRSVALGNLLWHGLGERSCGVVAWFLACTG